MPVEAINAIISIVTAVITVLVTLWVHGFRRGRWEKSVDDMLNYAKTADGDWRLPTVPTVRDIVETELKGLMLGTLHQKFNAVTKALTEAEKELHSKINRHAQENDAALRETERRMATTESGIEHLGRQMVSAEDKLAILIEKLGGHSTDQEHTRMFRSDTQTRLVSLERRVERLVAFHRTEDGNGP